MPQGFKPQGLIPYKRTTQKFFETPNTVPTLAHYADIYSQFCTANISAYQTSYLLA